VVDFEASGWWKGREFIGVGGLVRDHLKPLLHEEHQRPMELEE